MAANSISKKENAQLKLAITIPAPIQSPPADSRGIYLTRFRCQLDRQLALLPADLKSRLNEDHLVFFILDLVGRLDLSGILSKYEGKSRVGRPAYDPLKMFALVLYCYCTGTTSARGMERSCQESVPCCVIMGNQKPDHATISDFLLLHRTEFDSIFQQVLRLADESGLVKLDHAALDGSKLHANASRHKAMSYERMCENVEKLPQDCETIENRITELEKQDTPKSKIEADEFRKDLKFKERKLAKIKKWKKKLERRVRLKAKAQAKQKKKLKESGRKVQKVSDPKTVMPEPTDQINFTDEDSRIMGKKGKAFEQSYNVQIVVDSHCQIIVAHEVVQQANDKNLLVPMLQQLQRRLGSLPNTVSADAGYFSAECIESESLSSVELLVPPDRETHPRTSIAGVGRIAKNISAADRMRRKLSTRAGKELYAQRKCIVEPVFGQVKESVLEFDQFSWRGLTNVKNQWALICTAHNLLKIHRANLLQKHQQVVLQQPAA